MSIMRCAECERDIDTDYWVEGYWDEASNKYYCESCAENLELGTEEAAAPDLLWFAEQIFNGLSTGAIRIETEQDETLANVLGKGRAAINRAKNDDTADRIAEEDAREEAANNGPFGVGA